MIGATLAMSGLLTAVANAHPGPPGHTHGDDWPFGVFITVAAVALGGLVLFAKSRGSGS